MKLSVSAFRAQATAQRKILKQYQKQLNYGACSSFSAPGMKVDEVPHMMVDKTGIGTSKSPKPGEQSQSSENSGVSSQEEAQEEKMEPEADRGKAEDFSVVPEKSPAGYRTKSNQRWMKLRTTVQLSGAISNTIQKSKPPLKREDSFLKRFSTRQIPETQETVDTGDETEATNDAQTQEEVNRRRRKRRKEQSQTVVNPDENFYFYWLMTVTVSVLYNLWTLIVRQSFPELQKNSSLFWYACDGFTDIVFVCDIIVQFRTGYLEQGLMVYDSKKLAKHYLKSRAFIFDLLALVPLDLFQLEIGVNPILRFPRFLKIYRVYGYYYIVESRTVYPNLWRVVNLIHILLILAHWFGCFYYLLSEAEGFQGAWVYPYRQGDDATLTRKYLGSLYWSTLTLTTIGDLPTPETNAESRLRGCSKAMTCEDSSHPLRRRGHKSRLLQINSSYGYIFTIISYLIGVFIFATIVGQVGNVITNRNANRLEFERLLDGAKTYMRHHKVPGGMKRRVLRWYDYSWSRGRIQGGGDINTALGLLPDKLKTELALHVNLSVLKKVTIFQECQPEFLHDLVLKMKAYIFTPGDLICRKGEIAREMFIIADGILDVISETGRVLTTMKAGDFFGEIGILNLDGLNKRTADVRSVGYSELFSLSREDVLTAMKDYPEAQDILQSLGRKRLMEARNASKIHKSQGTGGKARQIKERAETPGESENAGKKIVEKLRSDVKGLKNALRRSRRETRDEDEYLESKSQDKKQYVLKRMNHVQSSDEYETNNEGLTPIGAGLPLLQRLKMLKEKQEREKEDKCKLLAKKENIAEPECSQRLVAVKEKDDSEEMSSEDAAQTPETTAIQPPVLHLPPLQSASTSNRNVIDVTEEHEPKDSQTGLKCESESGDRSWNTISKPAQQCEMPKIISQELSNQETSINVPNTNGNIMNIVPKQALGTTLEVPIINEKFNLFGRTGKKEEEGLSRKILSSVISGSDTLLEKPKLEQFGLEKRSRSVSPSDDSKNRRRILTIVAEHSMRERQRSKSLSTGQNNDFQKKSDRISGADPTGRRIKCYNSIDDLSPEYSGLPFVKKLKILNERQKLSRLFEKEVTRSSSLDVPERTRDEDGSLTRSKSVTGNIDLQSEHKRVLRRNAEDKRTTFPLSGPSIPEDRAEESDAKQRFPSMGSSGSLQSPESNETMERRHLKSILKKLSADDNEEDPSRRRFCIAKSRQAELKKLMRAPTVEGYIARHTKLMKSVTFDRETSQSPTEATEGNLEETIPRGLSPTGAAAAMLTLQLSNLSLIPMADPKKWGTGDGGLLHSTIADKLEEEMKRVMVSDPQTSDRDKLPVLPYENLIKGIAEIVQGHLDGIQGQLHMIHKNYQTELKKKDDIIQALRARIQELESRPWIIETKGPEKAQTPIFKEMDFGSTKRPSSARREIYESSTTGLRSRGCSPTYDTDFTSPGEESFQRLNKHSFTISETEENSPDPFGGGSSTKNPFERVGGESSTHLTKESEILERKRHWSGNADEIELMDIPKRGKNRLLRDLSLDSRRSLRDKGRKLGRKSDSRTRGSLINRVADFGKSLSRSTDFVAVDIDSSSDPEEFLSHDWEVRMLAEELSKKEEMSLWAKNELDEMRRLEHDVNTLKRVVCKTNLNSFTSSELDMLESILDAKDQKILEIASSSCLDIAKGKQYPNPPGRPPKIGQAFSFDFHDMDEPYILRNRSVSPRKQESSPGICREGQSTDNLLDASSLLKNHVLEPSPSSRKLEYSDKSRSSLPLVGAHLMPKNIRTSLPSLSRKSPRRKESATSSSDEGCHDVEMKESCDSVFDDNELEVEKLLTVRGQSPRKSSDGHNGINNFMRTVRQRVRQVVAGEGLRDQVPTISKLCDTPIESPEEIFPGRQEEKFMPNETCTKPQNPDQ